MSNIKKLSVATVYGKIDLKKLMAAPGEEMRLMTVIGNAVGQRTGQSNYGEWTSLQGMFEATNVETGEVFSASVLFLPDVALTPLMVQLAQPDVRGVEFAIEIGVRYADNGKPGGVPYEYTFKPLLPPDESDPVTRIKRRLQEEQLKLAGPAGAAPADAPAAAPAVKGRRK